MVQSERSIVSQGEKIEVLLKKESTAIQREEVIEVARRNEHLVILKNVLHLAVDKKVTQEKTKEHNGKKVSQIREDQNLEVTRN